MMMMVSKPSVNNSCPAFRGFVQSIKIAYASCHLSNLFWLYSGDNKMLVILIIISLIVLFQSCKLLFFWVSFQFSIKSELSGNLGLSIMWICVSEGRERERRPNGCSIPPLPLLPSPCFGLPSPANWMTKSLEEVCGRPVETFDYDLETKFQHFLPLLYDGLYNHQNVDASCHLGCTLGKNNYAHWSHL